LTKAAFGWAEWKQTKKGTPTDPLSVLWSEV
jgi:hypothetical protein